MKSILSVVILYFLVLLTSSLFAQERAKNKIVITGVRFAYPLVEKWIQEYKAANPSVEVEINPRTTTDPSQYDLLIEAYEQDENIKEGRDYLYIGRYALLPVANSNSDFAKAFADKGLNRELIEQIYFNDIYADKKEAPKIDAEYTVYTRLQKAGAPITFSKYFGFAQTNIKGKAIAGADEHLIKALLKDSTGVSYSVPGLLYNTETRKQIDGLSVIPVDLDDNGRVSNEEKFYGNLDEVLAKLEADEGKELKNIPLEYIHLSLSKVSSKPEAVKFLQWIIYNGQESLHQYGFLKPEQKKFEAAKEKFEQKALKQK
jgi:ABC-type phosphate transport system substrate-binding protein